jgi:hypothetical protein
MLPSPFPARLSDSFAAPDFPPSRPPSRHHPRDEYGAISARNGHRETLAAAFWHPPTSLTAAASPDLAHQRLAPWSDAPETSRRIWTFASSESDCQASSTTISLIPKGRPANLSTILPRSLAVKGAKSAPTAPDCAPHADGHSPAALAGGRVPIPRTGHYAEISRHIRDILLGFTPQVEPLSVNEAFLDLRGPAPEINVQGHSAG